MVDRTGRRRVVVRQVPEGGQRRAAGRGGGSGPARGRRGSFTDARVGDAGIRDLYGEGNVLAARVEVERLLSAGSGLAGLITAASAEAIHEAARVEHLDPEQIAAGTERNSHPLVSLVEALENLVGEPHGGDVHKGATTQNITQTANLAILHQAHRRLLVLLSRSLRPLARLADQHAETPMAGRTHTQHAVPISFGLKVAQWTDELLSRVEHLQQVESRVFRALLGGAAGTQAALGPQAPEIERYLADGMGLGTMPVPSRASFGNMAEWVSAMALLSADAEKMARDLCDMMQPEFGEAAETMPDEVVGSTAMAQKVNPQLLMDVINIALKVRSLAPRALDAMVQPHEGFGAMDWLMSDTLEETATLMGDLLIRLASISEGLAVNSERMRENLNLTRGGLLSERVLTELIDVMGRHRAHEALRRINSEAARGSEDLATVLRRDPEVSEYLNEAALKDLLAPEGYLGRSGPIARATAARAREVADLLDPPHEGDWRAE